MEYLDNSEQWQGALQMCPYLLLQQSSAYDPTKWSGEGNSIVRIFVVAGRLVAVEAGVAATDPTQCSGRLTQVARDFATQLLGPFPKRSFTALIELADGQSRLLSVGVLDAKDYDLFAWTDIMGIVLQQSQQPMTADPVLRMNALPVVARRPVEVASPPVVAPSSPVAAPTLPSEQRRVVPRNALIAATLAIGGASMALRWITRRGK